MKKILNYIVIRKSIPILLALLMGTVCISKINIHTTEDKSCKESIQKTLEHYFDNFLDTLLEDSEANYSSDDFSSINGYIIAKNLVSTRETYHKLLGGIHTVDVQEVIIDDISEKNDSLEVVSYVTYKFSYGNDGEEEQTTCGTLYRVTLEPLGSDYRVTDIDNTDIEIQKVKNVLTNQTARNAVDGYNTVDDYFEEIQKNADTLLETPDEV